MDAFFAGNRHIGNIPEEFKESPEIVKAIELAQESAYISTELATYDEYLDAVRVVETVREDALKVKKLEEEKKTMTRQMLPKGMSIEDVSELTGFSMKVIQSLLC